MIRKDIKVNFEATRRMQPGAAVVLGSPGGIPLLVYVAGLFTFPDVNITVKGFEPDFFAAAIEKAVY